MRTLSTRGRLLVLTSLACIWGTLGYACSVEDENPGSSRNRLTDAAAEGSTNPSGADAALGAPICGKYGGYDKVMPMAYAILATVEGDCRIGPAVSALDDAKKQHLQECFAIQLGGAFQCPNIAYTAGVTTDSQGRKCRSMQQAHQGMNLRKADFDAFMEDVAAELGRQGLSPEDVRAVLPVFEGTRTTVVQTQNQPDRNTYCGCPDGKYEGKDCKVIVDAGNTDASDASDAADAPSDG
jgi:hypothetical protein